MEEKEMLYPFMTLDDGTEIVHSDAYADNNREIVKVEIEKPVEGGFHSASIYLPDYTWENVNGFSEEEIARYQELIESLAHIIIQLAREGGFENASGL